MLGRLPAGMWGKHVCLHSRQCEGETCLANSLRVRRAAKETHLSESKVFFQNVLQYTRLSEGLSKDMLIQGIQGVWIDTV